MIKTSAWEAYYRYKLAGGYGGVSSRAGDSFGELDSMPSSPAAPKPSMVSTPKPAAAAAPAAAAVSTASPIKPIKPVSAPSLVGSPSPVAVPAARAAQPVGRVISTTNKMLNTDELASATDRRLQARIAKARRMGVR